MATKTEGKGRIRALNRKGVEDRKVVPAEKATQRTSEPRGCKQCGAVFSRRVWRRDRKITGALLDRMSWTVCPACRQAEAGEYYGRVLIRGAYAAEHDEAIRRRIANVDKKAQFTQPQRRVLSAQRDGAGIEVLTTSQKLAHRIVRELQKTFRGRASYHWSEDGTLYAVWQRTSAT